MLKHRWHKAPEPYLLGLSLIIVPAIAIANSNASLNLRAILILTSLGLASYIALRFCQVRNAHESNADRFQKLFDTNIIGFVIGDRHGRILDANDYYLDMIHCTREDLKRGLNWKQFTPQEHMDASIKCMRELVSNGQAIPFEKEYVRADGSRVWAMVGATMIGERVVSYVLDISDRKRVREDLEEAKSRLEENVIERTKDLLDANRELFKLVTESEIASERLRESQSFLDSVIENIPNLIFVKDAQELRFVRLNRAVENLVGLTKSDLIGKSDHDLFPKEQADFFTEKDRAVLREKLVLDISEEPIATPKGERFLHTKKIPICDKHGNPVYLLGISEDITEKKLAEVQKIELMQAQAAREAAERTAEKLQLLAEATSALNASLDVRSLLKAFSESIVKTMADWCIIDFYYDKDQSIERMVATAADGNLPDEVRNWWERKKLDLNAPEGLGAVIRTGEARIYRNLDANHASQYFSDPEVLKKISEWGLQSTIVAPLAYHGKVFGTMSLISTSERVYNDVDLSITQDLAKRASLAIENARLYAKAFEASRAKSAFLANISHEIRTPLGAMLGFAELILEDKTLNAAQVDYVSTIARNGRQLLRIVDEVLDLSKVESDRIQIERVSFSLPELFEEVRELLAVKSEDKGLTLSFKGIETLPLTVVSDSLRLRQVLVNVIGNAIKFTDKGSVTVSASYTPLKMHANHGNLEVVVSDTGVGLGEDQTGKLFQPFVQADESTTRKFGGTGLGLFLSRKLARLLGGDVTLRKSALGRGSEFVVTIEVEAGRETAVRPQVTRKNHIDEMAEARVLVVDDSPDNRMLIGAMLKKTGVHLDMAENGRSGVERALENKYDLVLMDIQMPEMDGYEAIKTLTDQGYDVPVVALTAHAMKGDRERCIKAGFTDYICKPVTRQALLNCLERYTGEHSTPHLH